jgi:hypothetical protein
MDIQDSTQAAIAAPINTTSTSNICFRLNGKQDLTNLLDILKQQDSNRSIADLHNDMFGG